jgi:hypothetical protein
MAVLITRRERFSAGHTLRKPHYTDEQNREVFGACANAHIVLNDEHSDLPRTIGAGIRREKTLKTWRRAWKVRLITESNPNWDDLYDSLLALAPTPVAAVSMARPSAPSTSVPRPFAREPPRSVGRYRPQ